MLQKYVEHIKASVRVFIFLLALPFRIIIHTMILPAHIIGWAFDDIFLEIWTVAASYILSIAWCGFLVYLIVK